MNHCYYAHSIKIYGTKDERLQLDFLRKRFDKVTCPNNDLGELGAMKPYLDFIQDNCSVVVCSPYKGFLGKGQYSEVHHALSLGKPVFILRRIFNKFFLVELKDVIVFDENDWKIKYAKPVSNPRLI